MSRSLIAVAAAAAVAALPAAANAQQLQRQETVVTTTTTVAPPVVVPSPVATATVRTYTYEPVCVVHRVPFSDEYGWRVRDVRICY